MGRWPTHMDTWQVVDTKSSQKSPGVAKTPLADGLFQSFFFYINLIIPQI